MLSELFTYFLNGAAAGGQIELKSSNAHRDSFIDALAMKNRILTENVLRNSHSIASISGIDFPYTHSHTELALCVSVLQG